MNMHTCWHIWVWIATKSKPSTPVICLLVICVCFEVQWVSGLLTDHCTDISGFWVMWKAKELWKDLWEKVIELYKTGERYKKISSVLRMSISSVQTLTCGKWEILLKPNHHQGDQQKFLPQGKIVWDVKTKPRRDCSINSGVDISTCTVRRHMKKMGCVVESLDRSHHYASATPK